MVDAPEPPEPIPVVRSKTQEVRVRLVTYRLDGTKPPATTFGCVRGDGVIDARAALEGRYDSLRAVLDAQALPDLAEATSGTSAEVGLDEVQLLPPVPDPRKIICVGVNYRTHLNETSRPDTAYPTLFSRFADTLVGHRSPALKPEETNRFDYEGELAVVIGEPGDRVDRDDAWRIVAGFACYNDFSVRDWQRHTSQFLPGKNFPATGGFGPWMVTADDVDDVTEAHLETRVNGETRQSALVSDLVFTIPELIAYITTFTQLSPGDVIVTGTPGGVGLFRDPPTFLDAGDVVDVEVSGIGLLTNEVAPR